MTLLSARDSDLCTCTEIILGSSGNMFFFSHLRQEVRIKMSF